MDKNQVLSFIREQMQLGKISSSDLLALTDHSPSPAQETSVGAAKGGSSYNLVHTFYAIGAIIAVIGVIILIVQNWEAIGFLGRILVTLGIAIVSYMMALIMRGESHRVLSEVLFTIATALAPIGTYVLLDEANVSITLNTHISIAIIFTIIFGTALAVSKRNILVLITLGFASWAYWALIGKVIGFDNIFDSNLIKWASMLLGFSYLAIAYGHQRSTTALNPAEGREKEAVRGLLYALGTLGILGAGIMIGGMFDVIFIAFIFAAFYGSVFLKSRAMLLLGALFLMGHIIKLTSRYFVNQIGWPISLIGIGFCVIGIGYLTYYVNKQFITNK